MALSKTKDNFGISDDELDAILPYLVNEGFLKKQVVNGKIWYKRTNKKIPTKICQECGTDNFMHIKECSQADLISL